jgi:hypothetical protein
MNPRTAIWAVLALLATSAIAGRAEACDGPYFARWGGSHWLYPSGSLYAQESAPYFALHPPVYYSYPVARTYGFSPFPYPPEVLTPEQPPQPSPVTANPFVAAAAASADDAGERPQVPRRMNNPFYVPAGGKGTTAPTDSK